MSLNQLQTQFAAHIRNPSSAPAPTDVEDRRVGIYRDLFFNNIDNFVSNSFPVLRSLIVDQDWQQLVRDFMVTHRCQSPYFLEISQEFLLYLQHNSIALTEQLPFMLELAHYEWVELGLDVAEDDLASIDCNPQGDLLNELPVVSPLAWSLAYQYPVHLIGEGFQPQQAPEQPTYLVVYRNRDDVVSFMETNAVTARLLELLQGATVKTGAAALQQIAADIAHPDPAQMLAFGQQLLQQLCEQDIILGTRVIT